MNAFFHFFACHQFIEDRQHLLAVLKNGLELFLNQSFVAVAPQEFVDQFAGQFDIAAQGVGGVAAQEQAIEKGRLALGREGIEFLGARNGRSRHKIAV